MNELINIYDPIQNKIHRLNFNEIRFWVDVAFFQKLFKTEKEVQNSFQRLDGVIKENVMQFLDSHEKPLPLPINNWNGIPGLKINFTIHADFSLNANSFHDNVQQNVRNKIFSNKELFTKRENMFLNVKDEQLPLSTVISISNEFYSSDQIKPTEEFPVFDRYLGNGSNFADKFFINYLGEVEPIHFNLPLYEEADWKYYISVTITQTMDYKNVLWLNVPKMKYFFDFMGERGYRLREDGPDLIYLEQPKTRSILEYSIPSSQFYPPFITVREHEGSLDFEDRDRLGEELRTEMEEEGLLDEIQHFRAYLLETEALNKIQNKNKTPADELLSDAIAEYDKCEGDIKNQANLEAVFCAWLKSRIAVSKSDLKVKERAFSNILERYADKHLWEEFIFFLDLLEEEDRGVAQRLVRPFLPVMELDKFHLMSPTTYKRILEYWDKGASKDKCPNNANLSEWHYSMSLQAYDIGLKETARKHLISFFRATQRNPEGSEWTIEGTEEMLDFAVKVEAKSQYKRFAQTMANFMKKKRKTKGIGDMSAIGRKEYRWTLLSIAMSEARWAFHTAFIQKKENREKKEFIKEYFLASHDAMLEAIHHYDPTEFYTKDQTIIIGKGFWLGYQLGFQLRHEPFMIHLLELARELWKRNPSKELYQAIHTMFHKDERKEMADLVISNWIEEVKEKTGAFILDIERVTVLADLYLSVEEWENCAKTLKHGLTKLEWNFEDLNKVFKTFYSLHKYDLSAASICEEEIYHWIQVHINEKISQVKFAKNVRARIKRTLIL